jgi:hypothetical protein
VRRTTTDGSTLLITAGKLSSPKPRVAGRHSMMRIRIAPAFKMILFMFGL